MRSENQIIRSVLVGSTVSEKDRILYFHKIRLSLTAIAVLGQVTRSQAFG